MNTVGRRSWKVITLLLLSLSVPLLSQGGRIIWSINPFGNALWQIVASPAGYNFSAKAIPIPGIPLQVRADLEARAVLVDALFPLLHFVTPSGIITVPLPGRARDAIPDGHGGALALLPASGPTAVCTVMPDGRLALRLTVPWFVTRLRLLRDGTVLLSGRFSSGSPVIERRVMDSGVVLARWIPTFSPWDIVFDDAGHILLPGSEPAGIPVLDQNLRAVERISAPNPVHGVMPFMGGGVVLLAGWPLVITPLLNQSFVPSPFPFPGGTSLEGLPDGTVVVHDALSGQSCRFDPVLGVSWIGWWPGALAPSDGAGLQHGRSAEPDADPDGDGFPTRVELAYVTDPGDATSVPFDIRQEANRIDLLAPRLPGAWYVVEASVLAPPGALLPFPPEDPLVAASLQPGVVFHLPVGLMDSFGLAQIHILPPIPPSIPVQVAGVLVDPVTFELRLRAPARTLLP